jgi:hypothetical protein
VRSNDPGRASETPRPRRRQALRGEAAALLLERRHWLAALAVLFVFFAPYQTLVQTVLTDDAVRKASKSTITT